MVALDYKINTRFLTDFEKKLGAEFQLAITDVCFDLFELMGYEMIELGAYDTFALYGSRYVSVFGFSNYDEAAAEAADAYLNNPTKWPRIREATMGILELDHEIKALNPREGYVAVAAAHGKEVEEGYVSYYHNWVEARPFMSNTAHKGYKNAVRRFEDAIRRAMP